MDLKSRPLNSTLKVHNEPSADQAIIWDRRLKLWNNFHPIKIYNIPYYNILFEMTYWQLHMKQSEFFTSACCATDYSWIIWNYFMSQIQTTKAKSTSDRVLFPRFVINKIGLFISVCDSASKSSSGYIWTISFFF